MLLTRDNPARVCGNADCCYAAHAVGIARRPNTRVAQRPLPGALGSGFGKNRSDDETKALASLLIAWDNVSKVSDEAA